MWFFTRRSHPPRCSNALFIIACQTDNVLISSITSRLGISVNCSRERASSRSRRPPLSSIPFTRSVELIPPDLAKMTVGLITMWMCASTFDEMDDMSEEIQEKSFPRLWKRCPRVIRFRDVREHWGKFVGGAERI